MSNNYFFIIFATFMTVQRKFSTTDYTIPISFPNLISKDNLVYITTNIHIILTSIRHKIEYNLGMLYLKLRVIFSRPNVRRGVGGGGGWIA